MTVTHSDPSIALTYAEHQAILFAAEMLRIRADELDGPSASFAGTIRGRADVLQDLHDRWHQARVVAALGVTHGPECGYCSGRKRDDERLTDADVAAASPSQRRGGAR